MHRHFYKFQLLIMQSLGELAFCLLKDKVSIKHVRFVFKFFHFLKNIFSVMANESYSLLLFLNYVICYSQNYTPDQTVVDKLWSTGQVPLFVNEVVLRYSHAHSFIYYLCLLLLYSGKLSSCDRDQI